MPKFQVVQHPNAIATVFVVTPDDNMEYESTIKNLAQGYRAKIVQETPVQDGGMIYQFNFPDRSSAKRAMRDFKTAREFNLV